MTAENINQNGLTLLCIAESVKELSISFQRRCIGCIQWSLIIKCMYMCWMTLCGCNGVVVV